ncbi:Mitogen-activated protein kinase hog1 [Neolecta irregularis DAH-3]|uniref:mitogen-activated protein kinase n=1 Tax=Neolecta irregularis (strain DAH-3) TaxID=1198029 RepID=A0A1U7LU78_NEOID|nr:Mitogen-activated protein kinase hog1 [Neolecta irregularis DAH-3]|eukprot:OLL26133.1 Mitogen-activated protein kinase hog1 [Neolecta irregularis DAH-3]
MGAFGLVWFAARRIPLTAQLGQRPACRPARSHQEDHEALFHAGPGKTHIPRAQTAQTPQTRKRAAVAAPADAQIISLSDIFISPLEDIYFVTELLGTDLHRLLTSRPLEKQFIQYFLYQILVHSHRGAANQLQRGLKYVHSADVVHRDLKPSNILVNENCDLKICDFGLARIQDPQMTGYVSTRYYRAPEIMLTWQKYDTEVDIWSAGCIFAEMLDGKPLFPGKDHVNQFSIITELLGTPPDDTLRFVQSLPKRDRVPFTDKFRSADPCAIDLLEKMLVFDPRKRITAEEALKHEYLAPYHDPSDEPFSEEKFDWSFNDADLPVDTWKVMMYSEILDFHNAGQTDEHIRVFSDLTSSMPVIRKRDPVHLRYLHLLNTHISLVANADSPLHEHASLGSSEMAGIYWTCFEKDLFFKLLARYGKHQILKISRGMKTKGPLACQCYLLALQNGINDFGVSHSKAAKRVSMANIPSAREMSDSWIHMEEKKSARIINCSLELLSDENKNREVTLDPEDKFFRTCRMIRLSQRIFMNRPDRSPPLRYGLPPKSDILIDSLDDMKSLIESITYKILQQVMSVVTLRLKAENPLSFSSKMLVRENSREFWSNISNRLGVSVVDRFGRVLDSNETRDTLEQSFRPSRWKHAKDPMQDSLLSREETLSQDKSPVAESEADADISDAETFDSKENETDNISEDEDKLADSIDQANDDVHEKFLRYKIRENQLKPRNTKAPCSEGFISQKPFIPIKQVGPKYSPWESLPRQQLSSDNSNTL